MPTLCDSLQSFIDGELSAVDAEAFSTHLVDCERCQTAMTRLLQLEQMGQMYVEEHGPVAVPWHAVPRNRWMVAGAVVASLAATVLFLFGLGVTGQHRSNPESMLWAGRQRTLEARITYSEADRYRQPTQAFMGSAPAMERVESPHAVLLRLEESEDLPQLAAAYLFASTPDVARARQLLERMRKDPKWNTSDVLCDLGVAHYMEARSLEMTRALPAYRKALQLFNEALRRNPKHRQARWNRALVLRDLGLPLSASIELEALAQAEPDEQWRNEARDKRKRLATVLERKERWQAADSAGYDLIVQGASALARAQEFADIPSMRRDFYHAVRVRTSAEQVKELLPLARTLDAKSGGEGVLEGYVSAIAARNFTTRAPLASQYAHLVMGQVELKDEEALLTTFLNSGEEDIALGALAHMAQRLSRQHLAVLAEKGRASPDPWFQVLGLQARASLARMNGEYGTAEKRLEEALYLCQRMQLAYRCIEVRKDLSSVAAWLFKVSDAEEHAREGLWLARLGQWDQERALLQLLGNAARLAADVTLGRAYFGEALLMAEGDRTALRNIHQDLAHLSIEALELDEARAELDKAMAVGAPLSQHGIEALVDVARQRRSPRDEAALEQALALDPGDSPGQRAYQKFLRGRFAVEVDPPKGRELLEEAIQESGAQRGKEDVTAEHAYTYSYTSLIFADAAAGDFTSALRRFGAELGFEVPSTCVVALTEDTERGLVLARGSDGRLLSHYLASRVVRFDSADMTGVVSIEMVEALRPCASVDVLARPPLQGRAGLLPMDFAWRYRTRATPPKPPKGRGVHVVVSDVRYDDRHRESPLTWLPHTESGAAVRLLKELDATPSRVLAALPEATELDLATHGKLDPRSNMAFLLLAPEPNGGDTLKEERIRRQTLSGAPLVVLAACEAGRGTSALHEHGSLPNAFLSAGARTVLAATQPIPNADAAAFFGEVRERIFSGVSPSVAVRDSRVAWSSRGEDASWVKGVLVFE